MTQTPALTSDEVTALNGVSTRLTYLKQWPATSIATARVNGSLAYPIADIPTTSESGGWTNVKKGMTLLIGTAAGLADVARFRVREDVGSTGSIAVGEFGANDTGAVSFSIHTAISNGHYLTVVNTRDIHAVFPRINYNGGTSSSIYEDFELTNIIANLQPSPVVRIATNNSRGGHYAVKVADGATVSITAAATVEHWPSSSSVVSYVWTYPAGFTGVSGDTSATLTATAPVGNHEISCTVTANYGAAITAVRYILVCDDTTNPAIPIASYDSDTRNKTARRVSLGINNTAVTSIPDGSGVIMWDECTWNGTSVPTASTIFVGWLSQIGFGTGGGLRQGSPEIIGVGEVLNYLTNTSQLFEVTNIPTVWQQMGYSLATFNWVIWWILTYRASNILTLFNFHPYSTSASVGRLPAFDIGAGTILGQVQSQAQRYRRANVGSNSGGEILVTIPAHMIEVASRSGLITRAEFIASRVTNVTWRRDLRPRVRSIDGQAFTWDGVSALPTPLKSIVPERPAQGSSDDTLGEQIVASQSELNATTGLYYAWVNNPIQSVTFVIPHNYDVIEPAEGQIINVTIPADYSPTGVEWEFDATAISVGKRPLTSGATEIELTVEPLTAGAAGATVPVPPPGENLAPDIPPIGEIFPIDPIPDWGGILPIDPGDDGQLNPLPDTPLEYPRMFGATTTANAWKAQNSVFTDISPTTAQKTAIGTGIQLVQDPWNYKRAYLVGSSGIVFTNDINASSVVWNTIARYDLAETWQQDDDFTASDGGWSTQDVGGSYSAGVGWSSVDALAGISYYRGVEITKTIAATTITNISFTYNLTKGTSTSGANIITDIEINGSLVASLTFDEESNGTGKTLSYAVRTTGVTSIAVTARSSVASTAVYSGSVLITSISIVGEGSNPFDDLPGFALDNETLIGSFQGFLNKKNAFCWLSKRTISAVDYVYFNRTIDNFITVSRVQVATWVGSMLYSITVDPFNWRYVWCTAGDPGGSDAFVYQSSDGGGTFTASTVSLYTHGGILNWNWSTGTANAQNTTNANVLIGRGLNGSNNYLVRRGLTGSDITIANGAGKYGLTPNSLYQLPRDGDYVRVGLQDNAVRLSSDFAASFSAGTAVTGGASNVLYGLGGWPTDSAFGLAYGYRTLAYTVDTYSSYTSLWSTYDTFRSGAYSSDGETIVSVIMDLSQHYIRPIASEA